MKFLDVNVKGFARFHEPFSLRLDAQGLVLVEGRNHDNGDAFDSNGSGKSMLFEAIKWCLFGKMSRYGDERIGAAEVTHDGGIADVTVQFQTPKGTFEVRRWRGPKSTPRLAINTLTEEGAWKPLKGTGVHADDGTDSLIKLLGFDYSTLRYALTLEGTSLDIAADGFTKQMKILESILRFDIYSDAQVVAKTRGKTLNQSVSSFVNEMERQDLILRQARGAREELESLSEVQRERELSVEIKRLTKSTSDADSLNKKVQRARASYEMAREHSADLDQTRRAARTVAATLAGIDTEAECPTCQQPIDLIRHHRLSESAREAAEDASSAYNVSVEQRDTLHDQVEKLIEQWDAVMESVRELRQMKTEQTDLLARKAKRLTMIASHDEKATEAESRLAELTEQVADARRIANHADSWATSGFPHLKEQTITLALPVLEAAASRYGQILADGAITVTFHPDAPRQGRGERFIQASGETGPTYESMSNGEKRRAQIIVALALRDLARWRIGTPINFSVWDEVFDPLDESGIVRAMEVLQQDQDEMASVFVITHNPQLKARFPGARTIRIEREGGNSRVVC